MANEFKIKKGLIVTGASGGTVVDIQGSQGQLFSVTDDLSGSIFAVSDISGVPILDINSSGLSTFDGNVNIDGSLGVGTSSPQGKLSVKAAQYRQLDFIESNNLMTIRSTAPDASYNLRGFNVEANTISLRTGATSGIVSATALTLDASQNATFAADVISNGNIKINTGSHLFFDGGTNATYISEDVADRLRFFVGGEEFMRFTESTADTVSIYKDTTFGTQAFATTATSSGDASSTLTTKGYVDGLITGATIYRGAWDPSGSGYGSPDLSTVTQTSGYYYICSAAGTAEPNGTGTEPDTWETGDWVIYNDVSGTGQWQKIDNSSVLSGVGTGQTVALWEGAGSVTDSETLGNAPITVSGNDTTFAGDITVSGGDIVSNGNTVVSNSANANTLRVGDALLASTTQTIKFRTNGTDALQLNSAQNATFAGTITSGNQTIIGGGGGNGQVDISRTSGAAIRLQSQSALGRIGTSSNHSFHLFANDATALTLDTSQNATFAGDVYIPEYIYHSGDTNTYIRFTADTQTFRTGGDDRLILTNTTATFSGAVAVNGTNVTVANASNPYIYVNDTNAGAGIFQQEGNTTRIGSDSNTQVVLVQNNATAVTIDTSKNVGIGTTSPDFKLDVDGTFGVSDLPFNTDSVSVLVADETIGADLVTNGDFATNTDWTEQGGAAAWSIANGKANCVVNSSTRYFEQPNVLPSTGAGNTYKVVYTISGITQGQFQINIGGYGATPGRTTNGTYAETFTTTSASSNNRIYLQSSPNTIGSIDNISVQLVTSASNQIQKRELGTGAFGPTPVGAYLPLSAGSGEILTGDLAMNNNIGIITKDSSGAFRDILKLNSSNVLEIGSSSLATNTIFKNTGNVGIGNTSPVNGKLVVTSGVDGPLNTVRIQHTRNDANVDTRALEIDMNLSGADTTTADRTNRGIYVDLDSSANGDASNEQRLRGIDADVRFTGFTDAANAGNFYVESNYTGGKTAQLIGVVGEAVHDSNSTNGGVSNMYGAYGTSSIQDLGDVDNAFGGYFSVTISTNRGNADVGVTKGVEGHIDIDKADTITYGEMMAVSGVIDNNEGTVPNFGNQYLFKGDYQGTKGDNAWGIYTEGDKHYFDGKVGIGTTAPSHVLSVQDSVNNADVGISINNSFDDNLATSNPNAVVLLNAASNNGYLRVHGAPANTASKHQVDLGSTAASSFLTFSPSGEERMRIDSVGNVGIGVTSLAAKLNVVAGAGSPTVLLGRATGQASIKADTDSSGHLIIDSSTGHVYINNYVNKNIYLANGGGNVGIGTTSPGSKLVVAGGTDTAYNDGTLKVVGSIALNAANNLNPALNRWVLRPRAAGVEGSFDIYDARHSLSRLTIVNSGNVGIGEANPTAKLEVYHSGGTAFNVTGSQGQLFSVTDDLSGDIFSVADISGVPIMNVNSDGTSYFDGKVGIGTNSPSAKLEVSGNVVINSTGLTEGFQWFNDTNEIFSLEDTSGSGELLLSSSNSVKVKLNANGNSYLNGGNVGIGTTSPGHKLHVENTESASWTTRFSNTVANSNNIYFGYNNGTTSYGMYIDGGQGAAGYDIQTASGFTVRGSGNVGIGTTSPTAPLHVIGTVRMGNTSEGLTFSAGSGIGNIIGVDTGFAGYNAIALKASANTGIYLDTADNVGIGTTSPGFKLQVNGTPPANNGALINIRNSEATATNTSFGGIYFNSSPGNDFSIGKSNINTATTLSFRNGNDGASLMDITPSGNVGIGTTSPGSKLEVSSGPGANGDCILIVSADTDNSTATSSPKLLMLQKGSTKTSLIEMDSSNRTHFSNQDGYYFSGGNVGIGTTSPTNPLHVHTDTDDDYAIRIEGSTNNVAGVWTGLGIGGEANNTKSAILFEDVGVSYSRGKLHLCVNNAADQTNATTADAKLTVSNDGNVGIGTTSPGRPLSVNSDTSHKAIRILENDSGNESWDIGVDAEGDLNFFNSADTSPTVSFLDNGNATFAGTLTVDGSLNLDLDLDVGATATFNDQTFFYDDLNISGGIIDSDTTITATNFILSSDERLKENVKKVCDNRVKVDWKTFELKTEKGQKRYGVIAQELEKTNPEFVRENNQGFKSVAYIDLLIAKIAELEARLEKLEK